MAKSPQLTEITDFQLLLQYLGDHLHWPVESYTIDDLTFSYDPEELGLNEKDAVMVRSIRQLRPLEHGQPWGIFLVEFEKKKLPVVLLRRILSHLVLKKRASANNADRARWHAKDLLFVTQFEGTASEPEWAFAHFKESMGDLPTLNVLGWDGGDTPLKLTHLRQELETYLSWPDDTSNVEAWRKAWSTPFKHGISHTIRTADALAEEMAKLAKRIRDAAQALMKVESEKGPLRRMHAAFKTALIHDLTPEGFADTYAQTITYGLLTAAISRTDLHGGKHGTNLVADNVADMVPITNPFLKEMLQSFLKVGGRKGGIDFDELGVQDVVHLFRSEETDLPAVIRDFDNKTRGEDPVIHFYEHFLAKYNKKLKVERGVFYTPKPVVGFIVRSVDELLRTEFDIADGLASTITWREMAARNAGLKIPEGTEPDSPFVMVLDPATGTATFLVEVIDLIHKRLKENWAKGGVKAVPKLPSTDFPRPIEDFKDYWNSYVALSLLRRLHGYELMMAPYAIAHMKIGLKLAETGYRFGVEERARVYLTNALELASDSTQLTIADWGDALAHESEAVNEVKRKQQFTVVIGNPPYSGESMNKGQWIRELIETYMYVDGVHLGEKGKKNWLQDDYVKFIRMSQFLLDRTRVGILGFITNHSFIDSPTFRGMRSSLMQSFAPIHVMDLHGNSKRKEVTPEGDPDENVFDIQQGVSIALMSRSRSSTVANNVGCAHAWGTRASKYERLKHHSVSTIDWNQLRPSAPHYLFVQQDAALRLEYDGFCRLTDIMPHYGAGVITSRDEFVIDFEDAPLRDRLRTFSDEGVSDTWIRDNFGIKDNSMWSMSDARTSFRADPIQKERFVDYMYRPFDRRRIYFETNVVFNMRTQIMKHLLPGGAPALVTARQATRRGVLPAFVTKSVIDAHAITDANSITTIFPLFISEGGADTPMWAEATTRINIGAAFSAELGRCLSEGQQFVDGEPNVGAENILHYLYSILYSPSYCARYLEFLKIDFPRLPLTRNAEMFRLLSSLGSELFALHLVESPTLVRTMTEYIGDRNVEVEKVSWSNHTVWIDKAQRIGFKGVPEEVWNYHVGGYQVCHKWLKDRGPKKGKPGRTLSAEDIAHYQKVVVALSETIRIQKEIDEVIEKHGGWPGAFATNAPLTPEAAAPTTQPKAKKPKATAKVTASKKAVKDQGAETSPGYIPDPGEIPFG